MALPSLSYVNSPGKLTPVNAPMVWSFTASFAPTSASIDTSSLVVNLEILNQNIATPTVLESVGRFYTPPRGDKYFIDLSAILKNYVTYPFNSATVSHYVNETTALGSLRLAPETEGVVRYSLGYGLQWNPNDDFESISSTTAYGPTLSVFTSAGLNAFGSVGDIITINVDSGLYTYWNGTASIVAIYTFGAYTYITTDQIANEALLAESGGAITGRFTSITHIYGTFSNYYGYNGTRQMFERNTDYLEKYGFQGMSLNTYKFMNDYGWDSDHAIRIKPYQGERTRCIMDFYGTSCNTLATNGLYSSLTTYSPSGATLSVTQSALNITDSVTSATYSAICYTVGVFDNINTIPIVDANKYKFTVYYLNGSSVPVEYASIWYVGDDKCSRYDNYRIKFLNKAGSWSYFNFNKNSLQTSNIERTEFIRSMAQDWTLRSNDTNYSMQSLRGTSILSSKVYQTFTLDSDWVTEDEYKFLAQLVESPEVYLYFDGDDATQNFGQLGYNGYRLSNGVTTDNGVNIPIIITDNNYAFKTTNRETLFNLQVSFKYAFETNLQNQ